MSRTVLRRDDAISRAARRFGVVIYVRSRKEARGQEAFIGIGAGLCRAVSISRLGDMRAGAIYDTHGTLRDEMVG